MRISAALADVSVSSSTLSCVYPSVRAQASGAGSSSCAACAGRRVWSTDQLERGRRGNPRCPADKATKHTGDLSETIEGPRTMRNRPYPVLKCSRCGDPSENRDTHLGGLRQAACRL